PQRRPTTWRPPATGHHHHRLRYRRRTSQRPHHPPFRRRQMTDKEPERPAKPSQATQLIALAVKHYRFGISSAAEPFAVPRDGPNVALMFRGGRTSLRAELAALYLDNENKAPSSSALADCMLTLEGLAQRLDPTPLALRVGRHNDD